MKDLKEIIVNTANEYIGKEEIRGNLGFQDKEFERKMRVCGFKKGQAWCCYFAELVWKSAYQQYNAFIVPKLDRLFNSSVVATFYNFRISKEFTTGTTPIVGSLAVWQNYRKGEPHWTGHIGIVTKIDRLNGKMITIEGNTNDDGTREGYKVASKLRDISFKQKESGLVLLGFVHPKP